VLAEWRWDYARVLSAAGFCVSPAGTLPCSWPMRITSAETGALPARHCCWSPIGTWPAVPGSGVLSRRWSVMQGFSAAATFSPARQPVHLWLGLGPRLGMAGIIRPFPPALLGHRKPRPTSRNTAGAQFCFKPCPSLAMSGLMNAAAVGVVPTVPVHVALGNCQASDLPLPFVALVLYCSAACGSATNGPSGRHTPAQALGRRTRNMG